MIAGTDNVDCQIAPAESADAATLTEIAFAAKRHWGYPEAWMALWADELTVSADDIATGHVYCARLGAQIVGWCALAPGASDCELGACWVLPGALGQGVGRRLVEHVIGIARDLGTRQLIVVSDPNAVGFYRRLGFVPAGEQLSEPAGRRLPVLRLDLAPL